MNKLKKILKEQYYMEAPDQLNSIKEKIELKESNNKFIKLQRQNLFLKYSNVFSFALLLIIAVVVVIQMNKPQQEVERITITEYIDITLRTKVREENIKEIYGIVPLIPLSSDEKTIFMEAFNDFQLSKSFVDIDLSSQDYLYYHIVFNDNSEIICKVHENNVISINIDNNVFYFYEYNCYEILK